MLYPLSYHWWITTIATGLRNPYVIKAHEQAFPHRRQQPLQAIHLLVTLQAVAC
jgi:hypothetical protein